MPVDGGNSGSSAARTGKAGRSGRTGGSGRPASEDGGPGGGGGGSSPPGGDSGRRRSPITKRAAILAVVIAALVVSYASSLRAWVDQRSQIEELEQTVTERRQEVRDLERELERWEDPAYVKAQARERFGWVMPGETGYVVVGRDGRTPNQEPDPNSDPRPKEPWWQSLWGSVEHAGDPPAPSEAEQDRPRQPAEKIGP